MCKTNGLSAILWIMNDGLRCEEMNVMTMQEKWKKKRGSRSERQHELRTGAKIWVGWPG